MYMRQLMQLSVALMFLMPSATLASGPANESAAVGDSVTVVKKSQNSDVRTVTGTVYDAATNTPMAGVRVQATGHKRVTTMTNAEGKYKLNAPSYVTLLSFSTSDYLLVQKPIGESNVVNVRLYSDDFNGYYQEDVVLTAERGLKDDNSLAITVEEDIQGKLGADVRTITRSGTPGVGAAMLIRGINSLNANTQPLVVVDGVIWDMQEGSQALHAGIYNNILSAIDVNDIRDVKVLKNGAAIYGARAANGVLIIETKRGESMATRITANVFANVTAAPSTPDMLNSDEYRIYANDLVGTMDVNPNRNIPFLRSDKPVYDKNGKLLEGFYYYNKFHNDTNWFDYVYREAVAQNYKVNVEGGDEVAMYNFSFGYTLADSPIKGNDFNRLNIRLNSDIVLADNFKTGVDISYANVGRELLDDGFREDATAFPLTSLAALATVKSPFLSPYRYASNGKLSTIIDVCDDYAFDIAQAAGVSRPNNALYNPLTILTVGSDPHKNEMEYTNMGITVSPELKLGDFTITERFNYSLYRFSEKYYLPYPNAAEDTKYHFFAPSVNDRIGNYIASYFGKETALSSDTRVHWRKVFGEHSVEAFGGFRYTNFAFDSNSISGMNSGSDISFNVDNSAKNVEGIGDNNVWSNMAWYLSADYDYKKLYFLQFAASLEASSRFGTNADNALKMLGVSWGFFPSVQAAWLISSESWFKARAINLLKLRAGFDMTGNDAIDFYACQSYLQNIQLQDKLMGLQLGNVENDGVKWETTSRFNVGLDAVLFGDRLSLSLDWYKSITTDLLVPKAYPFVAGMDTYWANGGTMENMGVEFAVNAKLVNTLDFQWELGASLGHYKNKVTSLDENIAPRSVYGGEVLTQVGQPLGVFYGYKTAGVISSSAEADAEKLYQTSNTGVKEYFGAGDVRFVDLYTADGKGYINENDKTVIGNPNPDLYGNIYTKFVYRDWQLNVGFNYSLGNDVYNYYRQQLESGSNFFNQTTAVLNRWSYDGQETNTPRIAYGDPMNNNRFSDRWIEDASYLRLKKLQISYNLPLSLSWLQGITIWGAAENLLTFTKYLGSDPEFSVSNNVMFQGVDAGLLPQSRSFHLGVKVNL